MNLTRRGFLGGLVAVALGAKVLVRGESAVGGIDPTIPSAGLRTQISPYSIPAFINEQALDEAFEEVDFVEPWRFSRGHMRWTDEEINLASGHRLDRVHKGPRGKMRKAPRDQAYYDRKRVPSVRLPDYLDLIKSTGRTPVMPGIRSDEAQERIERTWRSLWGVPDRSKIA